MCRFGSLPSPSRNGAKDPWVPVKDEQQKGQLRLVEHEMDST